MESNLLLVQRNQNMKKYRNLIDNLKTKPTPEECKEYFETIGIEVEILPSSKNKLDI